MVCDHIFKCISPPLPSLRMQLECQYSTQLYCKTPLRHQLVMLMGRMAACPRKQGIALKKACLVAAECFPLAWSVFSWFSSYWSGEKTKLVCWVMEIFSKMLMSDADRVFLPSLPTSALSLASQLHTSS